MNTKITPEILFQIIGEQHVTIRMLEAKVLELTQKLKELPSPVNGDEQ